MSALTFAAPSPGARPLHLVPQAGLSDFMGTLAPEAAAFLKTTGFTASRGALQLLPGPMAPCLARFWVWAAARGRNASTSVPYAVGFPKAAGRLSAILPPKTGTRRRLAGCLMAIASTNTPLRPPPRQCWSRPKAVMPPG